jgi:hypothetical protein
LRGLYGGETRLGKIFKACRTKVNGHSNPQSALKTFYARKEIAQKIKEETEKQPPIGEEPKPTIGIPPIAPIPEKETITKLTLKANVPWDKLSDLMRGVFMPLNQEGAQISLEIKIEAQSLRGISKNTLDLKIKETLNQIGANILEEQEE